MTVAPFALPDLIVNVVDLPYPPSVNAIWRHSKGQVHVSARYREWKAQADATAVLHRRRWRTIKGAFTADIALSKSHRRSNHDGDNRIKCVLDWAESRELIANDKFSESTTVRWVDVANAPTGCRLTLRELSVPA